MKIAVFGANGSTGRLLTQLALGEDHDVVAFTRHADAFPIEHRRLEVAGGDVHDAAAVASAITGTDAVLSTLGVPFAKTPITVYSDGVTNIIAGMHAAGVERLATVSSSAVSPHPEPLGGFIFEKIIQPYVVNKLGKTLYDDMRRMEAIVSASDLAWTIVRPSGLFEAPAVSAYSVAIDHLHVATSGWWGGAEARDSSSIWGRHRRLGWWARDDRGGQYWGQFQGGHSASTSAVEVTFAPALDPNARALTLELPSPFNDESVIRSTIELPAFESPA